MEGKPLGSVFDFFEKVGVIAIELEDTLKLGDTIRVVGGEKDFTEVVDSMQINGEFVEIAKPGDRVGIKVSDKAHKGYKVYKVY